METAIIILGIIAGASVLSLMWLGKLYVDAQKVRQTEREYLTNKFERERETLTLRFNTEREQLLDRLLKRNGVSPIHEEKKEQVPFVIESALARNARIKEGKENPKARIKVNE